MFRVWLALLLQGFICFVFIDNAVLRDNSTFISWAIVLLTSAVFVVWITISYLDSTAASIIIVGYVIRIAILFWDSHYRHIFTLIHAGADADTFYLRAQWLLYDIWHARQPESYVHMLHGIFRFFGHQRIIAQYINLLLGVTGILIIFKTTQFLNLSRKVTIIALSIGMFLPNFAIQNVVLLRESTNIFFQAASLYCFIYWAKRNNIWSFILAVGLVFMSAIFHSAVSAIVFAYGICFVLYDSKAGRFKFRAKSIAFLGVSLFALYAVDYLFGSTVFGYFGRIDSVDALVAHGARVPHGGAAYTVNIQTGIVMADFLLNTPIRMVYFVLSPLPGYWRGIEDVLAFAFSSVLFGSSYYMAIRTIKRNGANKSLIISLLIISIFTTFVFGWGVSNAGTALRHRNKFLLQHVLMLSLCLDQKKSLILQPFRNARREGTL